MSININKSSEQATIKRTIDPVIDCDVHPNPHSYEDLNPYLSPIIGETF